MISPMPLLSPHSPPVDWCFFLKVCPCGCLALVDAAGVIVVNHLCHLLLAAIVFPVSLLWYLLAVVFKNAVAAAWFLLHFSFAILATALFTIVHHPYVTPTAAVVTNWLLRFWRYFLVACCWKPQHAYLMWHQVIARAAGWLLLPIHRKIRMQLFAVCCITFIPLPTLIAFTALHCFSSWLIVACYF